MATVRGNGCRCVQTHCFPFGNVLYIELSYPGKWAVNVPDGGDCLQRWTLRDDLVAR